MVSIQKLSFQSETNLLQQMIKSNNAISAPVATPAATISKEPISDTVVLNTKTETKKQNKIINTIKEYSGIAALALSITAIPITYALTKKSDKRAIAKLENNVEKLTKEIEKLIKENSKGSPEKLTSLKDRLVTTLIGLGSGFGIFEYLKNHKNELNEMGISDEEINAAKNKAQEILEQPQQAINKANEAISRSASAMEKADNAQNIAHSAKDKTDSLDWKINTTEQKAELALNKTTDTIKPENANLVKDYYDLKIRQCANWQKKINNARTNKSIQTIQNAAQIRNKRAAQDTILDIQNYKNKYKNRLTSLWSLTAEFKPIKLGGLGDVPVDLQDNFTKLGIDNPTFIPMYEAAGIASFIDENDTPKYKYGKNTFNLRKLADINLEVFKNGKTEPENIEYYLSENSGKQIIFVRSKYFKDGGIYDSTTQATEPEKFAIFDKAVYNLAKIKVSEALGDDAKISYKRGPAYHDLQAPNSMILNDWHAAPMAGLLRYKSSMEYNYNELNSNTFDALSNMPILMIGHNLKVQGASNGGDLPLEGKNSITQNIINTLYDQYAYGIVENAHSGIENEDMCNTILLKRTTSDKQFNPLFHGIALSDWFVPVSKNYANEIVNDVMQSGIAKPILEKRKNTGTIEGIINGTDYSKHNMHQVSKNNYVDGLILEEYNKNNDISQIMDFRYENKRRFFHKFLKPILDGKTDKLELINPSAGNLKVTEQEFMEAPLLAFAHRLTDQKGLSLLKDAIFMLFDNWEREFGDKPEPFFIIGGPPESATEVGYLNDLRNPDYGYNKKRLDRVFTMKGNMPNPAIMSASTYFCAPSTFEPCGLTQGECFAKGTPVIATDTGGYHDTIKNGVTGFLSPYINSQALYDTIVKALHVYYDDNQKYQQMIKNDLATDFSWARPDRQGSIYEYTEKLGFDNNKLPDIGTNS